MLSKTLKVLIIIACITTGIVVILLAPIIPARYKGTETIEYSDLIEQINVFIDCDASNIYINYETNPSANLINLTYLYIIGHTIFEPAPTDPVTFKNLTTGNVLTINITIDFPHFITSIWYARTYLIINPHLLSNLSIHTASGTIELNTANFQNKTFERVYLSTSSGNCQANFINGCNISDNLSIITSSGDNVLTLGADSEIQGQLSAFTSSGNNDVTIADNCILNKDFTIQTSSGYNTFTSINVSLNNKEIIGTIYSSSGGCRAIITQILATNGNLTLNMHCSSGNCHLNMDYAPIAIASVIIAYTSSGSIFDGSLVGFTEDPSGVYTSNYGMLSSNINADIDTSSGNIRLEGGYD